jgi:hypothetical protein
MGATLGNLKRKRRQPDVRNIKRHSDYVQDFSNRIQVGGPREQTDTGYTVEGFVGKSFETYFENMLPSTSGPILQHDKKDKTIRVLSGILLVTVVDQDSTSTNIKAIPGDEIILERGESYRLYTSKEPVSFFVCQNAKYAAALQVLEETTVSTGVPDSLLQEPSVESRLRGSLPHTLGTSRKGSKAKEQLAALRAAKENRPVTKAVRQSEIAAQASYGTNPRPGGGNFDKEGAG